MSSQLINDDLEYKDNSYATKGNEPIPVQKDDAKLEDPISADQDSDAQLNRDDKDAIDESNIIGDRTRGAAPAKGAYREPGDEEGLGPKEEQNV
ncbi:hypothetical protein F5X68DRAFT_236258 [Plectosphaerella plurivora]|uniref:Histone chaperone domain-containing protein n=1 Tax=Plectosphaerella plurivora TaxID=936078 RepID=A0A9P8V3P9_9PEZI|nr:hypothetical protein F5X68DRAFT_236258 [Plectosphaerella plurivora]